MRALAARNARTTKNWREPICALGMFGFRLGRYTREEFDRARTLRKDCLVYVKGRSHDDGREPELQTFLERIGHVTEGLTICYFGSASDLCEHVKGDVARWQVEEIRRREGQWKRVPAVTSDAGESRALASLAGKVRHFWIDGVLATSIQDDAPMPTPKETRPDAVSSPWERILELPDQTRRTVPADQPLEDVFYSVGGSLLVLGAPGSGKTITLTQLAKRLLDRSEYRPEDPVPVIFNLSTWSEWSGSLEEWLVSSWHRSIRFRLASGAHGCRTNVCSRCSMVSMKWSRLRRVDCVRATDEAREDSRRSRHRGVLPSGRVHRPSRASIAGRRDLHRAARA